MEGSTKLIGTLIRLRRRLILDIVDNMILLVIMMILLTVLPSVTIAILRTELTPPLRSIVNCITMLIMMHSLVFCLSLSIWDLYNILIITPRIENISYIKEEKNEDFWDLLNKRHSMIRKILILTAFIVSLSAISLTEDYKKIVCTYLLVDIFKDNPQLLIIPPVLIALFPLIYSTLLFLSLNRRLSRYWDKLSSLPEDVSGTIRRCNVCGEVILHSSIHCPFCGAYVKEMKESKSS